MSQSLQALIIEDDRLSAKVLETLLRQQGASVIIVSDPARLSELLPGTPEFGIIFIDLEMPHLTGYEVLALLRKQLGHSVPLVAYTVHISEALTARKFGFDGFLGKPLDGAAFPDVLRRLLAGEKVWTV